METTAQLKLITYDRTTKDYAYFIRGELVGFASTYLAAQQAADAIIYEELRRPNTCLADVSPEDAADILVAQDVAREEELAIEAAAGVDYFDRLDQSTIVNVGAPTVNTPVVPSAPRPIYIRTPQEAAFAIACIRRRKAAEAKEQQQAA